ncbi:MAG: prolipoprotein diacylglyceryl transferase [Verrucomicrobiota bacterium]
MSVGRTGFLVQTRDVFGTYVHHLDPVIFKFTEAFVLRWYGLAYLLGFLGGYLLLKRFAERKLWVLGPEKTADFIAAAALFGVFIGGRLGYVIFYQIPRDGLDSVIENPLGILKVWEGGMASHGGILGLVIFTFFYARKHKVSWTGLGDGLCVVAPIGLLCGRIANFINGELYGRVAEGLVWAVKFPMAFTDPKAPESLNFNQALIAAGDAYPPLKAELMVPGQNPFLLLAEANRRSDSVNQAIEPYLEPRHPSQIYEALLEGGLLLGILWFIRVRFPKAPSGLLTGLFFALYATFRIFGEQFREPDADWVIEKVLTMGQFLSIFMYVFAGAFLIHTFRNRRQEQL